jgi:nicotinate phosphoribosyltransferase
MMYQVYDPDEYIVRSFLDTDFYKFTMGDFIFSNPFFANAIVTFRLKCRTKGIKLGEVIPIEHLERELDHAMRLRPTNSEIYYLRGMDIYGDRMLSEPYLQFLKTIEQLPPFKINVTNGDLELEFTGPWKSVTYWEIFALEIINELYHKYLIKKHLTSTVDRNRYLMTGLTRFLDKVKIIKQHPGLTYSDFGTRRRASARHQEELVTIAANELPDQFRGTSNVYLAHKLNLMPIGTDAHETKMVPAGLADIASNGDRDAIRASQHEVAKAWWKKTGFGLSIALTDTYGTKFIFETAPPELAVDWKGTRHDSGDRFRYTEKAIQWYRRHGVNPENKIIIFSDGLELNSMIQNYYYCRGKINSTNGWGTNKTNDFEPRPDIGLIPLSLVVKPSRVSFGGESRGLVKLSDNIAKAMGTPEDIARYKGYFDYDQTYFEPCTY